MNEPKPTQGEIKPLSFDTDEYDVAPGQKPDFSNWKEPTEDTSLYSTLCDVMDWGNSNTQKGKSPEKAEAAILATHIPKDKVRAAIGKDDIVTPEEEVAYPEDETTKWEKEACNKLRSSLRQQLLEEDR